MTPGLVLVLLVGAERLGELAWSARNAHRLRAVGAVEVGAAHYPAMVAFHGLWYAAMLALAATGTRFDIVALAIYLGLEVLRAWTMASLGGRWTTRVLVAPTGPLVRHGPYRWLRHPNYLVVAGELAALPMVFGAWQVALAFGAAHVPLIAYRIRVEDAALDAAGLRVPR